MSGGCYFRKDSSVKLILGVVLGLRRFRQKNTREDVTPKMKTPILLIVFGGVLMTFAQIASAQKPVNIAGNWDVTVKMPNGNVNEKWTLRQTGTKVSGTAKT